MGHRPTLAALALAGLLSASPAGADGRPFEGRVLAVHAGDRLVVAGPDGKRIEICLAGVEAPAADRLFGRDARRWVDERLSGRGAEVTGGPAAADCTSARVVFEGRDIARELIRRGLAREAGERRPALSEGDRLRYRMAEDEARARNAGLWAYPVTGDGRRP